MYSYITHSRINSDYCSSSFISLISLFISACLTLSFFDFHKIDRFFKNCETKLSILCEQNRESLRMYSPLDLNFSSKFNKYSAILLLQISHRLRSSRSSNTESSVSAEWPGITVKHDAATCSANKKGWKSVDREGRGPWSVRVNLRRQISRSRPS